MFPTRLEILPSERIVENIRAAVQLSVSAEFSQELEREQPGTAS